jgi:ParB-like chromosome segregation protein Spo0J
VAAAPDEDLEPLAASIARDGVSVIPVVRQLASGVLEILTERSVVRAAALAGLASIRVEVRPGLSDRVAMRIAITTDRARPAGTTRWGEALDVAGHARLMEAETGHRPTQREIQADLPHLTQLATVNGLLRIATLLADLERAGLPVHIMNSFTRSALLRIATAPTHEARIEQLHRELDGKGKGAPKPSRAPQITYAPTKATQIYLPPFAEIAPSQAGSLAASLRVLADALDAHAATEPGMEGRAAPDTIDSAPVES